MGYCRFVQMTATVKFMAVYLFPAFRTPPARKAGTVVSHTGTEIAIRFLGCPDKSDDTIQVSIQFFIVFNSKRVGSTFYCFIRVSIIKGEVTFLFSRNQFPG